ncbi:MAG: CopG family antitoxin [Deltaproteobacteria bacterium]|nr:CopG family antitoxin [Deltaproteobacteria bacterium]
MKKKSFSKKFKSGEEMDQFLENADLSKTFAKKGVVKKSHMKKINLDLPADLIQQIDEIAERIGVARQPLLKIWIHERLKTEVSR